MFEGYGPGGAAVLVMVATDNRNRTVSDIRHMFSKNGGNLGNRQRLLDVRAQEPDLIEKEKADEDTLMTWCSRRAPKI